MSTENQIDPQAEISQLTERKRQLALEVVNGNNAARTELSDVNTAIAALRQEIELRELAESERQRLAAEAEKQRLAEERRQKETVLHDKRHAYREKLSALDERFKSLATEIEDAIKIGKEVYQLSMELGQSMRWRVKADIANALKGAVRSSLWPEVDWISPFSLSDGPRQARESGMVLTHNEPIDSGRSVVYGSGSTARFGPIEMPTRLPNESKGEYEARVDQMLGIERRSSKSDKAA